jgi:2,4-dienoyl-CoA reductase (NADPH2)
MQAIDVITGKAQPIGKCVVLGGRNTAIETTLLLSDQGKDVSLITRGELGIGVQRMTLRGLQTRLIEAGIPLYTHTPVLEIRDHSVLVKMGQEVASIPAGSVITALGMQPENSLVSELEGMVPEVYSVGDCVKPRNAASVAYQAAKLAAKI